MNYMKAAIIRNDPRRISIEEIPIPEYGDNEVLVHVKSNGLCGSDVHGFLDKDSKGRVEGLIMGHECCGIIKEVGKNVTAFKKNDRVVVNPQFKCNECNACKHSWYTVCDKVKIIGSALRGFVQGAMAEYVVVGQDHLHSMPDNLSFEDGALVEPVANAIHAINRAGVKVGDNVVVMGAGTIGLCMLQVAKLAGAGKVISIDISDHNLEVAKKLGADYVINSAKSNPVEEVMKLCGNIGSDVTIEAVGLGPTYSQAAQMTRKRGTLVFFGAAKPTANIELYPILHRELNIVGSTGFDIECDMAIEFLATKKVHVENIITHRFEIEESAKGIEDFLDKEQKAIKSVMINSL